MKNLLLWMAIVVRLALPSEAFAHVGEPKHGGLMNTGGEISFELVVDKKTVTLYVDDHEDPVLTNDAKGTLRISRGGSSTTVELVPAGDNRVKAEGVTLMPGDKVTATLAFPSGTLMLGRFTIQ